MDNEHIYRDLLERMSMENKVKRQIPLINAGYAIRVLSISHVIYNFVLFHRHKHTTPKIQIVLLGCGLDVIGLWSYSVGKKLGIENLHVIEVDTYEVCTIKQDILTKQKLVVVVPQPTTTRSSSSSSADDEEQGIFHGNIVDIDNNNVPPGSVDASVDSSKNYTLVSGDLCNIPKLNDSLLSVVDPNIPTLVISELVLTYLPPFETQELLQWCASALCATSDSVLVALEPLGSSRGNVDYDDDDDDSDDVVVEGYKYDYCQKFDAKLQRGRATPSKKKFALSSSPSSNDESTTTSTAEHKNTSFYPLGNSNTSVEQLFVNAGFDVAHGTCLGNVAIHAMETVQRIRGGGDTRIPLTLESPEIFDEHAALTLHLKSYNLTCAFSNGTDCLLRRFLCNYYFCGASYVTGYSEPPPHIIMEGGNDTTTISLAVIQKEDQIQVRTLFTKAYEHLFEEYPAVRKMSKTALKTDLAINNSDIEEEGSGSDDGCSIATRYKEYGGIFVVAIRYNQSSLSERRRQVLGCVGVRRGYTKDQKNDSTSTPLEIFRLVVDGDHRGQGIGSELLRYVERFAMMKGCMSLVATTPAILISANTLYNKCGFEVSEEVAMGSLLMRTFVKKL